MPFQFEPYQSPYTGTIVDLMQAPARARAAALRAQGQATAQTVGGIGQAVTGTIGSILQQRADAPKREMMQLELQKARSDETERQNALVGGKRVAALLTQNPQATDQEVITAAGDPLLGMHLLQTLRPPKKLIAVKNDESLVDEARPDKGPVFTAPSKPELMAVPAGDPVIDKNHPENGPVFTAPAKAEKKAFESKQITLDGKPNVLVNFEPATGNSYLPGSTEPIAATRIKGNPTAQVQINNQLLGTKDENNPTAQAIAEYRLAPPSSRSIASGSGKILMDAVMRINPDYKADEFSVRAPTRKAFTTGLQGQQINAINTAIGHIDQLTAVAEALGNGSFVPGNALWNSIKSTFGDSAPTNFDTLKDALAGEVSSVLAKGGATVSGIAEAKEKINNAKSPTQLAGYANTLVPIFGSKLNELNYQYHQAMGESDPFKALSPESERILTSRGFDPAHPTIAAGAGGAPKEGATKPIDGYPGTEQTYKGGKWIRTK